MQLQVVFLVRSSAAVGALVGLLPSVDPHMQAQVVFPLAELAAIRAKEGLFGALLSAGRAPGPPHDNTLRPSGSTEKSPSIFRAPDEGTAAPEETSGGRGQ